MFPSEAMDVAVRLASIYMQLSRLQGDRQWQIQNVQEEGA